MLHFSLSRCENYYLNMLHITLVSNFYSGASTLYLAR